MSTMRVTIRAALMIILSAAFAGPAQAQEVPRAFRGLFRASDDPRNARQRLELAASAFAGWVHADVDGAPTAIDERFLEGSYEGFTSVLAYGFQGRATRFESISGGTFQHYSTLPGFRTTRLFERAQFRARLGPRTDVSVRGDVFYSPYYSLGLVVDPEEEEGEISPDVQEPFVSVRENLRLGTQVELVHRPSLRSEVAADYAFSDTRFLDEDFDLTSHTAGVRYRHNMTEHAHMRLGYRYHQWRFAGAESPTLRGHDIRAGVDYNRALPSSPRTRVGFDFGSTVARQPGTTRVDVSGEAFLWRRLSPDWVAAAVYARGFDVRAGLTEPLYYFSDTAAVSLGGQVARRAVVRFVGSYVRGRFAADVLENKTRSWNGTGGVSFGVARVMAVYAQATASTLKLSPRLGALTGLPVMVDRFAVASGVTIWFPLVR
jgi:hypothetical protein